MAFAKNPFSSFVELDSGIFMGLGAEVFESVVSEEGSSDAEVFESDAEGFKSDAKGFKSDAEGFSSMVSDFSFAISFIFVMTLSFNIYSIELSS